MAGDARRELRTLDGRGAVSATLPNVWRQWRAKRVHCTPGLGGPKEEDGCAIDSRESERGLEWEEPRDG